MGIEAYSTNADNNTAEMPEGQFAGTVNNGTRSIQAAIAEWYNDPGWWRPGAPARTCTRISASTIREPGVNVSTLYHAGRRIRVVGALTGTIYGAVSAATYTGGNTDVSIDLDSGTIAAEPITVHLSIAPVYSTGWLQRANTSWRGIVELATEAEAIAGTSDSLAVTPLALAAVVDAASGSLPVSSTTQKGIIETATTAEAQAGTDTSRAVTAAGVAAAITALVPSASTTVAGRVELATAAETRAGTDATRAMTPDGFADGFAISGSNHGIELPGGMKIQGGSGTTNGSGVATVTYPIAFDTSAAPVPVPVTGSDRRIVVTASSTTSFSVLTRDENGNSAGSVLFTWGASGY